MKLFSIFIGLLVIINESKGQFINRITISSGVSISDLEWKYDQKDSVINYANLGREGTLGYFNKIDFEYLDYKFINLLTGFGFYQKGSHDKWSNNSLNWYLDYLTIDIKLKVKYQIKNFIPYIVIGPRLDYLIKYSSEFNEYKELAKLYKINYGLRYGLGIQYDFGNILLGLNWQNNYNFNSIVENNGDRIRPQFKINDKTMIFNMDIGIKLKKD